MNNWVNRYHLIRRLLLGIFTYFYLKITYHIFFVGTSSDNLKISAYLSFAGIITFMIKFYYDSRNIEMKNNKDKGEIK